MIRKCMLTAAIVLLGVGSAFAQRSDVNVVPYQESFENLTAWGGAYTNVAITNGWYTGGNDISAIVYMPYTFTTCTLPLSTATHTNVLQLNTQGDTLTNSFGSGYDMSAGKTYVDAMVQFVPSESKPAALVTVDQTDAASGIKAACYIDTNTFLCVYCGVLNNGYLAHNTVENTGISVSTSGWHRLTFVYDATVAGGDVGDIEMFQIVLDGTVIQDNNGYAYADGWQQSIINSGYETVPNPTVGGTWFPSAAFKAGTARTLTAIAFQGTGYIDDLAVATAGTKTPYISSDVRNSWVLPNGPVFRGKRRGSLLALF